MLGEILKPDTFGPEEAVSAAYPSRPTWMRRSLPAALANMSATFR